MSAIADIYDFYTPVEEAIAVVFKANEITCYTPLGEQLEIGGQDPTTFQKKRPRVEIVLMPGASFGMLLPESNVRNTSGFLREKARHATLNLKLVTKAEIMEHRAFLAQTLYLLDTLAREITVTNPNPLPNHFINRVFCNGGSFNYNSEEGLFETNLTCDLAISVNENAWAALG